jgi:hypothetical protein
MHGQAFTTFPTVELAQRALVSDVTISRSFSLVLHSKMHNYLNAPAPK